MGLPQYLISSNYIRFRCSLMVLIMVCTMNLVSAQSSFMVMSCMGVLPNGANMAPAFSFTSSSKTCLEVETGIAVFSSDNLSDNFSTNCKVDIQFNTLGLKLYPNPVTINTKLKFTSTPKSDEVFKISIYNAQGTLIQSIKETGANILYGISFDFNSLPHGLFILEVASSTYFDSVKFIKSL